MLPPNRRAEGGRALQQTDLYPVVVRARSPWLYTSARRAGDIVLAALLLVVLAPVLLLIAVAIWLDSGLPIIYRCERLGRYGEPITVLKFRTMRNGSHHHLQDLLSTDEMRALEYTVSRKLRDDPRRTRVGTFLRRTSLDELPQLLNVLRGDMSLIGPRPYFPDELLDRPEAAEILSIRPGITGLWQINGRSDRTFEERVGFDLDYVRRRGALLDARIIGATIVAVVTGRGAY
jgi:exopolysaccharide production protein ExoY